MKPQRILVACHDSVLRGGFLRFERLAKPLGKLNNHVVVFARFSDTPEPRRASTIPILDIAAASKQVWDVVMVPGASFPQATIDRLSELRKSQFGFRIQHILNDQSRRTKFLAVNRSFRPNMVVFNNSHWPVGSYDEFDSESFHVLLGATDMELFFPRPDKQLNRDQFVIGGLAIKNPLPLVESLAYLPEHTIVRLIGNPGKLLTSHPHLLESGRLEVVGELEGEEELRKFYHQLDCTVMTETFAGWANMVAESMACGVPVVCTPHGTRTFAHDRRTALVVPTPTPTVIAGAVRELMFDPILRSRLSDAAYKEIKPYSWDAYARDFLELLPDVR